MILLNKVILPQMRSKWCCIVPNEFKVETFRRFFHAIQSQKLNQQMESSIVQKCSNLLLPINKVLSVQTCGLKYVGLVHRRCKDCHMMLREGIMHNYCKAHPRHNQKAKTARPKSTWIVSGVTTVKPAHWKKIRNNDFLR